MAPKAYPTQRLPEEKDPQRRTRTVDMKLLVLGLPRTSTSSIRQALFMLGYNDVYHMKSCMLECKEDVPRWADAMAAKFENKGKKFTRQEWDRLLGNCEAVTDYPPSMFSPELMDAYPEAKLILTLRDSSSAWKKSMLDTVYRSYPVFGPPKDFAGAVSQFLGGLIMPPMHHADMFRLMCKHTMTPDFPENGHELYDLHNDEVRAHARLHNREILEFNAKMGWKPLCDFLGVDIPTDENGNELPYPRVNDTKEFQDLTARVMKAHMTEYFWSTGIYRLMGYIAAGGALFMATKNRDALFSLVKAKLIG